MNYFGILNDLVASGQLEILYIVSPPRTLSTVLEIALSEYGHGQIHEPFHKRRRKDFYDGCRIVYERILELQKQYPDQKIKIVIKDLSKFMKSEEWERLVSLVNRFVFTIREPSRQIFSMASRYANDLDDYDVDKLDFEHILANLPRIPFEDLALGYWENLLKLLEITEKHIETHENKYLAIVSGMTFRSDLLDSIKKLLDQVNLDIQPSKVLSGWSVGSGDNFFRPEYIINNAERDKNFKQGAWLGYAINSKSFDPLNPKHDLPQDINIYDEHLQDYFMDKIMPVFIEIYLKKENVCKPSRELVFSKEFQDSNIAKANPIEAYLLSLSYQSLTERERLDQHKNLDYLEKLIKNNYPAISKKFFSIPEIKNGGSI